MTEKILKEYQERLQRCQKVFGNKFQAIEDSRKIIGQTMPHKEVVIKSVNKAKTRDEEALALESRYVFPIIRAVANKLTSDLSRRNFRFELEGQSPEGSEVKSVFMRELLKIYTYENVKKSYLRGIEYLVKSGTLVSQTVTYNKAKRRILPNGDIESKPIGRTIEQRVYDPLGVLLDPSATPGDVASTSEFIIVTLGYYSKERIKTEFNVDVDEYFAPKENIDFRKQNLEHLSGKDQITPKEIAVREYYLRNGIYYTVIGDQILLKEKYNTNGIADRIPFNICVMESDTDSPYGLTLYELLGKSGQLINSAINQVADNNARNNNAPYFTFEGLFPRHGLTIGSYKRNEVVSLDPSKIMSLTGNTELDIRKMLVKFEFPEITNGAEFLFNTGLQAIWFLTGLNPTTLSGQQEKQIRVSDVASMVNTASLRTDSAIVVNLETYLINPMSWDIVGIFDMYYKDFPGIEKAGVPQSFLASMKTVRVVNGSFLPADAMDYSAKTRHILELAMSTNSIDPIVALKDYLESLGIGDIERIFRSGLEILNENQLMTLLQLLQTQDTGEIMGMLSGLLQQKMEVQNETGRA